MCVWCGVFDFYSVWNYVQQRLFRRVAFHQSGYIYNPNNHIKLQLKPKSLSPPEKPKISTNKQVFFSCCGADLVSETAKGSLFLQQSKGGNESKSLPPPRPIFLIFKSNAPRKIMHHLIIVNNPMNEEMVTNV